ncbi:MAG: hypothetical protein K2X28_03475, partial [Alphaproteobacteria bacterium]|nr:hypothetical protein [Alphaproteobacteria bacterium]
YMIPSFFVYLDKIPLTSNGKIDRKSLKNIKNFTNKTRSFILPVNNIQFLLLKIWKEILKVENISINDDFFTIGGNSILAIKMSSYIQKDFSKKISISDIFKNRDIFSLSVLLKSPEKSYDSPIIVIKEGKKEPPLFMIHPGGGLAFCYIGLSQYINMPIYGINNPIFTNPKSGLSSIQEIAENYINLIKTIQKVGPYYLGGWSFGGLIALEIAQKLYLQNEIVNRLILIDVVNPKKSNEILGEYKKLDRNIREEESFLEKKVKSVAESNILNMLELNIKLSEIKRDKYEVSKYKGKVILLKAIDNEDINGYGWENYINQLQFIDIPGTHDTLFNPEYIQSTAKAIKHALEVD